VGVGCACGPSNHPARQARFALKWILAENARLPEDECHTRFRKWDS